MEDGRVPKVAQDQKWVLLVKFPLISVFNYRRDLRREAASGCLYIIGIVKRGLEMSDKEKFELDRKEDPMNYSTGMASDRRFGSSNLPNSSVGLAGRGDLNGSSSCSSASLVDSFGPNFWDTTTNSQNLGFCGINVHNSGSSLNPIELRKDGFGFGRGGHDHGTLEMGWNQGNGFIPNESAMFSQNLSRFPSDSGFIERIERATRFSCFGGGDFGDMVNAYGIPQSMGPYAGTGGEAIHRARDGGQPQESNPNEAEAEAVKDATPSVEYLATKASPLKNDKRSENHVMPQNEGQQGPSRPPNETDRAKSSDDGGVQDDSPMLDGVSDEPCVKGLDSKKRKRIGQDADNDKAVELPTEGAGDISESQQKGEQEPTPTNKASGKNAKQGPQVSDPPKEEYIHVRARRGQATNSHSLAERVRREKISERMKFLQDLVPGCSKVTGKAVMLDEIINYVQSLQRQVEFLSMKLATVNPRLDFDIEGLIPKDILHQRPGPSSALGFPLEMSMAFPPLHPSQPGLIQPTLPSIANSSDILRRTVHPQLASPASGSFKEPNQVPDVWEDELHNVVQMSFATTTAPMSTQDVDGTVAATQMKVEL
ncbi:hypothetical protein Ahy_A05g022113 [Arachis hypogaea]|uniref:BHLH domain-containing protein n=2 Tax=Arachis hypogaea TaxID=3818 RepID=A0A445CZN6_ARAHY|nr:hypothetical protein Ahy_A05g022113 [Arachis hypogaea]